MRRADRQAIFIRKPDQVPKARPNNRVYRFQRVYIDDGRNGIRRVVETIDKLETQRQSKRKQQKEGVANGTS